MERWWHLGTFRDGLRHAEDLTWEGGFLMVVFFCFREKEGTRSGGFGQLFVL